MSYKVRIPIFEGPFDLLVYLIEDAQMDIRDIRIAEITSQYLDYLQAMKELNVAVSSEFVVLASELLRIKTRMMLPRTEAAEGVSPEEDPRNELVRQILEYRKCRAQSELLRERQERMADIYTKPQEDLSEYENHPDEYLSLGMNDFVRAFRAFLRRKQKIEETMHRYTLLERERQTMEDKMNYITVTMHRMPDPDGRGIPFSAFVQDESSPGDVVVSFLSLLQMTRDGRLRPEQETLFGDIFVRSGPRLDEDAAQNEEGAEHAG